MIVADSIAYKILTPQQWAALEAGSFDGAPVDQADGYIHLSTAVQADETLARHFAGQSDLVIAAIDLDALGEAVRWEPSRGGALFPHVYGRLTLDTVIAHGPVQHEADGALKLPVAG